MEGRPEIWPIRVEDDQPLVDSAPPSSTSNTQLQRHRQLRERLGRSHNLETLYHEIRQDLRADSDWLCVGHLQIIDASGQATGRLQWIHAVEHFASESAQRLQDVGVLAIERKTPQVTGAAEAPGTALVAVPFITAGSKSSLVAVVRLTQSSNTYIEYLEQLTAHVELHSLRVREAISTRQLTFASALLDAVRRVHAASSAEAALDMVAKTCCQLFGAQAVAAAVKSISIGPGLTLSAYSADLQSQLDAQRVSLINVVRESQAHGEVTSWSRSEKELPAGVRAHQQLGDELQVDSLIAAPWTDTSDPQDTSPADGCLIIVGAADDLVTRRQAHAAAAALLPAIQAVAVQRKGLLSVLAGAARRSALSSRNLFILVGLITAAAVLAIRKPYEIQCDCKLEPVVKRFVSAPVEAPLAETLVRPGDVVEKGQLLATLDGRDLRWELAGIEADLEGAWKERDTHLALQKFAEAEVARLRATQLELRRQQVSHRLEELQIRSPFAGIIISGDLDKARGIRLTMGEQLFEIAPLDEMIVEVGIPESDISYVKSGTVLEVRMDAYPDQTWSGVLERVHPRSEVRDGENVFIGEVRFSNKDGRLRPGMEGRAQITGPIRSIGWSLFHRAAEESLLWLGW